MKHQSYWLPLTQRRARPLLDPSAYRRRFRYLAAITVLALGWSMLLGCGGSKSGDGPTRWTAVDKNGSNSKADR
jgi:hypothetical protein